MGLCLEEPGGRFSGSKGKGCSGLSGEGCLEGGRVQVKDSDHAGV